MEWWLQLAEIASRVAVIFGGSIGLFLAWKRVSAANLQAEAQTRQAEAAARQADLGRRKLVSDLFKEAVAQLADERLEKRLFAIHTLTEIALDDPTVNLAVAGLLSAYVRENNHKWGDASPPQDIDVIVQFLTADSRSER